MKIHFLGAGDIIFSLGTRYHIGQLLTHVQRHATLASFSFFQFRSAGTPPPEADGRIAVDGFPFKVYSPTGPQQYLRLPRPMFRFIERLRLWNFFRKKINAVKPGEKLILHGCLGSVHFCAHAGIPVQDRVWLKLGLLEEENHLGTRFYFRKKIERLTAHTCGRRVAVSRRMLDFLDREYGRSHQRDVVLPCLYDSDRFSPSVDRAQARHRLGFDNRVVFLYLGIGAPWQCPAETIAFFKQIKRRLPPAFLWILTPDMEIFKPLLVDVAPDDHRLEYCPHDELADRIQAGDFGFLLRKQCLINQVASPVKFPEYLASGLSVVIGPDVGDYTDLVREHRLGIVVDPERPQTWEKSIGELIAMAAYGHEMRSRAMDIASSLSWQSHSERILAAFEK
jgi:glycosyltransferase involved in cell wall biosynthesis